MYIFIINYQWWHTSIEHIHSVPGAGHRAVWHLTEHAPQFFILAPSLFPFDCSRSIARKSQIDLVVPAHWLPCGEREREARGPQHDLSKACHLYQTLKDEQTREDGVSWEGLGLSFLHLSNGHNNSPPLIEHLWIKWVDTDIKRKSSINTDHYLPWIETVWAVIVVLVGGLNRSQRWLTFQLWLPAHRPWKDRSGKAKR
jgi:hypothetical protein